MDKKAVFWKVCLSEFPQLKTELNALLPNFIECIDNGLIRPFNKQCAKFFERNNPTWGRYDKWLADDERIIPSRNEEEDCLPDYYEMGELFAHRLMHTYYVQGRKLRLLDNVCDRPYWQLITVEDGQECSGCRDDPKLPLHWQSQYWQHKEIPCQWLFCRSRIMALSEYDILKHYGNGFLEILKNTHP